jgi:hypothetical protein
LWTKQLGALLRTPWKTKTTQSLGLEKEVRSTRGDDGGEEDERDGGEEPEEHHDDGEDEDEGEGRQDDGGGDEEKCAGDDGEVDGKIDRDADAGDY